MVWRQSSCRGGRANSIAPRWPPPSPPPTPHRRRNWRRRKPRRENPGDRPMNLDASLAAVITGGASGLGAATARKLAGCGVRVAIFDLNAEKGEALAREIRGIFAPTNVTSE